MLFHEETEMMDNQKHAVVMSPDKQFDVLQTSQGDTLFFSIGTDNAFWLTREVSSKTKTGWTKQNLSAALSKLHGNSQVVAKSFALSQDTSAKSSLPCDLLLVVTVGENDYLYGAFDIQNNDDSWSKGVQWKAIPFDAKQGGPYNPFKISRVYIMNLPESDDIDQDAGLNIFVDVYRNPNDGLGLFDRYFIEHNQPVKWVKHNPAFDLSGNQKITNCLGCRPKDEVAGIYTFGTIKTTKELIYQPQKDTFNPAKSPPAVAFDFPPQSTPTAVASALDPSGYTNLFMAASGQKSGLYYYPYNKQQDNAKPVLLLSGDAMPIKSTFEGVTQMSASTINGKTTIWFVNVDRKLFYLSCPQGYVKDPSAWTKPVPICTGVEGFSFYINIQQSNNVLFAHITGRKLYKLTQNPSTTAWSQTEILLPPTDVSDVYTVKTFTTQIRATNDDGSPLSDQNMNIRAVSPVNVYINDVFYSLDPAYDVTVKAKHDGSLNIIQTLTSLSSAVCFTVTPEGVPNSSHLVKPLKKANDKLNGITSVKLLNDVKIANDQGVRRPLVPGSVSDKDRQAAVDNLTTLMSIKVPEDGSVVTSARPSSHKSNLPVHLSDGIELLAGDLYNYFDDHLHEALDCVAQPFEDAWHWVVHTADKVYYAVLDCVAAVAGAIEFVFKKIEAGIKELIAWLGFLFEWPDIQRTHKILKNIINGYTSLAVEETKKFEGDMKSMFKKANEYVGEVTDLTGPKTTIGEHNNASANTPGSNSPQSAWALHHISHGMGSVNTKSDVEVSASESDVEELLGKIKNLIIEEKDDVGKLLKKFKEDIVDKITSLTAIEIAKRMVGLVAELMIDSIENIMVLVVELIIMAIEDFKKMLNYTFDIPIISKIYEEFISGGEPLSILDLACMACAIPVTLICKVVTDHAPFPKDEPMTKALLGADTWAKVHAALYPNGMLTAPREKKPLKEALDSLEPVDIAQACMDLLSWPSGWLVMLTGGFKWVWGKANSEVPIPTFVLWLSGASSIFWAAPNYPSFASDAYWATIMNDVVTQVWVRKVALDNWVMWAKPSGGTWYAGYLDYVSPIAECVINLAWIFPAFGSVLVKKHPADSDYVAFAANMCFDVGGLIAPLTTDKFVPEWFADPMYLLTVGLSEYYGRLNVAAGGLVFDSK